MAKAQQPTLFRLVRVEAAVGRARVYGGAFRYTTPSACRLREAAQAPFAQQAAFPFAPAGSHASDPDARSSTRRALTWPRSKSTSLFERRQGSSECPKSAMSAAFRWKSGGSRGSQTRVPPCMPRRGSHRCPRSWACACPMPCDIRIGSHASRFRGVPSSHGGRPMRRRRSLKRASDLKGSKAGRSRMDGLNCAS
jgi:hypothetical protein